MNVPVNLQRNIKITNRLSLILGLLCFGLFILVLFLFGLSPSTPILVITGLLFVLVIALNRYKHYNSSRILLTAGPFAAIWLSTILLKTLNPHFTDIVYYDSRLLLILISIVPCLIFNVKERVQLFGSLGVILISIVLFDPIHNLLGIGYYQKGFAGTSYYYINYITVMTFVGITSGVIILKSILERAENHNNTLLQEKEIINQQLELKNLELQEAFKNIETQNEEITAQSEELVTNQDQLVEAFQLIESQKDRLLNINSNLEGELVKKNYELEKTIEELIKYNNELQQFSYTISHNLRGPVARLLGLSNLLPANALAINPDDVIPILKHIKTSAQDLDDVIRDLNKIIDIRNSIYKVKEYVDFQKEWDDVKHLLGIDALAEREIFTTDFKSCAFVYTIKPMISSIILNLVSNSLKFKSPDRDLKIHLETRNEGTYTVLEISDNGLGINMEMFGNDVFKMYKRFHPHLEGKGLGLYLIKSQAEALNGKVEITSKINQGTQFHIYIKNPLQVEEQFCFENDQAIIYYDAVVNAIAIRWKSIASSVQYRQVFTKCLEFLRLYRTPNLISDVRNQGRIQSEDQQWMLENITREKTLNALVRIVAICNTDEATVKYRLMVQAYFEKHGIEFYYFEEYADASQWLRKFL